MTMEAVNGFIAKINNDAQLNAIVTQAFAERSQLDLVKLGSDHGFAFSREEGMHGWKDFVAGDGGKNAWNEFLASDELPDEWLDAVAGGNPVNCVDTLISV